MVRWTFGTAKRYGGLAALAGSPAGRPDVGSKGGAQENRECSDTLRKARACVQLSKLPSSSTWLPPCAHTMTVGTSLGCAAQLQQGAASGGARLGQARHEAVHQGRSSHAPTAAAMTHCLQQQPHNAAAWWQPSDAKPQSKQAAAHAPRKLALPVDAAAAAVLIAARYGFHGDLRAVGQR